MGHVGPDGHMGHEASEFMINGYWGCWKLLSNDFGLQACIMGYCISRPCGILHHHPTELISTFYSKFKNYLVICLEFHILLLSVLFTTYLWEKLNFGLRMMFLRYDGV